MVKLRDLDPSASPLDYYGSELRRLREAAGLSQSQLGSCVFVTASLIGQVETTRRVPTRDFSERVDAALGTDGLFSRLVGLVLRSQLPTWFQAYAEMEARATYISTYQAQLVYGLLQTEGYARAVLATGVPPRLDDLVAARMERQRILDRDRPPLSLVILDEAVLHRPVGGWKVTRDQLGRLLDVVERRWVSVQVLPYEAGEHASLVGSFNLLRFDDAPELVYTEDLISGHMTANSDTIREAHRRYANLQAAALSEGDSAELINRVMEEHYDSESDPASRAVA
ncbi:Scr1 family TA system antitoxin-like transcriptional regulator [Streptomyces sp. NPDC020607]|uniref:helix-turn-helix domain-containing protein n=1 Tax=Streptomyces sp. NPDC020607 TaxID=3365082 RepID=UPI00379C51C6